MKETFHGFCNTSRVDWRPLSRRHHPAPKPPLGSVGTQLDRLMISGLKRDARDGADQPKCLL